jgi:hypothetical protein
MSARLGKLYLVPIITKRSICVMRMVTLKRTLRNWAEEECERALETLRSSRYVGLHIRWPYYSLREKRKYRVKPVELDTPVRRATRQNWLHIYESGNTVLFLWYDVFHKYTNDVVVFLLKMAETCCEQTE